MRFRTIKATYPYPVSRRLLWARFTMAVVFIVLALAQLFAFEKMGTVLESLLPGLSHPLAKPLAAVIVLLEVAAIPSFLIISLSPLARICSRFAGLLVMITWYGLIYYGIATAQVENSGLLGSSINIPANIIALLAVMVIFAATFVVHYSDVRAQPFVTHKR